MSVDHDTVGDHPHRQRRSDVEDFLKATSDASTRSRTVFAVLMLACVVTGVGIRNSMQSSWMMQRFTQLTAGGGVASCDPTTDYWPKYIGCATPSQPPPCKRATCADAEKAVDFRRQIYTARYQAVLAAMSQGLVETRFFVHAPIIGVVVDVNDLGYVSGIGLTLLFFWLLFCLRTEERNLAESFEALKSTQLASFYRLLAMYQVITAPERPFSHVNSPRKRSISGLTLSDDFIRIVGPKALLFCPLGVYVWLTCHDFLTAPIGRELKANYVVLLAWEVVCSVLLFYLTFRAVRALSQIDDIWSTYAEKVSETLDHGASVSLNADTSAP